jgi:diguanylate cyclase (GGDEF)-like protein
VSPIPDRHVLPRPEEASEHLQALLTSAEPLMVSDAERASELLHEAQDLAAHLGDLRGVARALTLLGGAQMVRSQYAEAAQTYTQARHAARDAGDGGSEARAVNGLGMIARAMGRYGEAMEHYLDSLRIAQAQGDELGQARTLCNVGVVHSELGDHELGLQAFQKMQALARRTGHVILHSTSMINVAFVYHELGRHDEALDVARAHLPVIHAQGLRQHEVILQATVMGCLVAQGHARDAAQLAEATLPLAREVGDHEHLAHIHVAYGQALLDLGEYGAAAEQLEAALQGTREHGLRAQERTALQALSVLHARQRHWEQAYELAVASHTLDRALHAHDLDRRTKVLSAQMQVEMLQREAEVERLRSAELAQMNLELTAAQRRLSYRATHDALTGLANRAHFQAELERALDTAAAEPFGVLFLDLDRFKHVNDTLGHDVGDALLCEVARRLRRVVRRGDLVARMGGDEFTVILRELRSAPDAERIARKILNRLAQTFEVGGHTLHVTASIGVAVAPQDGHDVTTLQKHADIAMYRAKQGGKNGVRTFQPTMGSETAERVDVERDLREALSRQELTLHYQPLYAAPAGTVTGFEALVRWNHPTQGLLPPGKFIGVAEDSGLIVPLGAWVLGEACRQAAAWQAHGPVSISVNVSPLQFDQPDFLGTVKEALQSSGLDPHQLILELTESVVIRHPESAVAQLQELRALGIRIALDDFGTGQSSLSLLRRLPIDILKIDRSFVQDDGGTLESAQVMVGVMVTLAHSFRMAVVAEGVETEGQLALVRALGCDGMQGYLLARPLSAEAARALLVTTLPISA